jgi:hypothetical protein
LSPLSSAVRRYEVSLADELQESEWCDVGWIEITPATPLYSVHEHLLLSIREEMICGVENLKGKRKKKFFNKWRRMRRHAVEGERIESIKANYPDNVVIRIFATKYAWYKGLPEDQQRAIMQCIAGAIRLPESHTHVHAHAPQDYVTGGALFEAFVQEVTGLDEQEIIEAAALEAAKDTPDDVDADPGNAPKAQYKFDFGKMGHDAAEPPQPGAVDVHGV